MTQRLADDFAYIRSRLEEIQKDRQTAIAGEMPDVQPMPQPWTGEMYLSLPQGAAEWDPA